MRLEADTYTLPEPCRIGVLALRSSIDSDNAILLDKAIVLLLEQHDRLVVDLAAAPHIDSAGWSVVIMRAGKVRSRIKLAGMSVAVRDVFDLLGLSLLLDAYSTVGEAVAACASEPGPAPCVDEPPSDLQ